MPVDLIVGMVLVVGSGIRLIVQKVPEWRRQRLVPRALRQADLVVAAERRLA
jgi:hypothetical protein